MAVLQQNNDYKYILIQLHTVKMCSRDIPIREYQHLYPLQYNVWPQISSEFSVFVDLLSKDIYNVLQ